MNLNPEQRRAVESPAPTIGCIAGPGSGKTEVLVQRVRRVIADGADPKRIALITYTNAAARVLEDRLATHQEVRPGSGSIGTALESSLGYCGTVHGFCLFALRRWGASLGYGRKVAIVDAEATEIFLAAEAQLQGIRTKPDRVAEHLLSADWRTAERPTALDLACQGYARRLRAAGLVDFDSLLHDALVLLTRHVAPPALGFSHVFWDEVQDAAPIDWLIVLALNVSNLFIVGDPDQGIYAFRGGRVSEFVRFLGAPTTERFALVNNYRSTVEICSVANALIHRNAGRIEKETFPLDRDGPKPLEIHAVNPGDEIAQVARRIREIDSPGEQFDGIRSSVAVIARTNAIAAQFRAGLKATGLPVVEPPPPDLPRDWPFVRSFVELLVDPENDALAELHLYQRGIKQGLPASAARAEARERVRTAHESSKTVNEAFLGIEIRSTASDAIAFSSGSGISLEASRLLLQLYRRLPARAPIEELALAVALLRRTPEEEPAERDGLVECVTAHSAKGREWDVVFVVGLEDEVWPGRKSGEDLEEERRLAFVAITRARNALFLSWADSRETSWGRKLPEAHVASRFIKEALG